MPFGRGKSEHIRLLGSVSLFRGCSDKELGHIQSLTTEIDVPAGEVLCREGQPGLQFFVIVDGQAAVAIGDQHVADLGAGEFFGEMALLDGGSRIATVSAKSPMRLLVLNRQEFFTLLSDAPTVVRRILTSIGARLREAEQALYAKAPLGV
jgi:CRP-like cAMP-binding protein